jgi:hypothetical protein
MWQPIRRIQAACGWDDGWTDTPKPMSRIHGFSAAAALLMVGPVLAQVDPKIAETCMRAQDFAGCVQTLSGGLPPKQKSDVDEGMRTWTRETGVVVRMRTASVVAMKSAKGEYGRHLKWVYGRTGPDNTGWQKEVQADCQEYTADWNEDGLTWTDVKDAEKYRRKPDEYEPVREAKAIMDEFCPQIERLINEAKLRDK